MRLICILLVTAASFLLNPGAVLTVGAVDQDTTSRTRPGPTDFRAVQSDGKETRFLRAREVASEGTDNVDEDSDDEERGKLDRVVSDLTDDAVKTTVKLTRSKSLPSVTLDEELAALKKFKQYIKAQYTPVFEDFAAVKKLDPKKAAEKWGIQKKLKSMSMDELSNDPIFLFWMKYKQYWAKHDFTP